MNYSNKYDTYDKFYLYLRKDYESTLKGLRRFDYDAFVFDDMSEQTSYKIYEILNNNEFKFDSNSIQMMGYNPLLLLCSLENNYYNTIKLMVKENERKIIKVPSFFNENKQLEELLVNNDFILNGKSISLVKNSPVFLLASLKNDFQKTIKVLKKHDLFIVDMDNELTEELIDILFYQNKVQFKNIPNVLKNIIVRYIHENDSNEVVKDLATKNLVPISYFPQDVVTFNDEILRKGCNSWDEYDYLSCKIGFYSSNKYEKEDEAIFLELMSKKYKNCTCVEDVIKMMYDKKLKRDDMSLMEVFAFNLYACKILKGYGVSTDVDVLGFDYRVDSSGAQNDKGIFMYINGECNSVYDMVRTINHEIEHVVQKEFIKNCRIDLDNDVDLYSKDFIMTILMGKEYYDNNSFNLSFEYDAEFKSTVRTALMLNLVDQLEHDNMSVEELFYNKKSLINYAKDSLKFGEYSYDNYRLYGCATLLNECFESEMIKLRESNKSEYEKILNNYPIIRYEYNCKNTFERKSVSELIECLDNCENNKDKGIYYNLLKTRLNDDKEVDAEDNLEDLRCEYETGSYNNVTKRIIGDLINKSKYANSKYNSYVSRVKKEGR